MVAGLLMLDSQVQRQDVMQQDRQQLSGMLTSALATRLGKICFSGTI
jgi:hypothetical protein